MQLLKHTLLFTCAFATMTFISCSDDDADRPTLVSPGEKAMSFPEADLETLDNVSRFEDIDIFSEDPTEPTINRPYQAPKNLPDEDIYSGPTEVDQK